MRRWSRSFYLFLLLLLLPSLVSCGLASTPTLATTAAGTLVITGGSYDPPTLDPALAGDASSTFVIRQLFSGLVALDDKLHVVADIASDWSVSPDGLVYTFHLRPDARFQDGRAITADDFIYSFERACDPALGPALPCATYLNDIAGAAERLSGQAEHISGLRAVDDHTLEITLTAPKAYFLSKLTYNTAYVVDRQAVKKGSRWTEDPNGSGPFRLAEWDHDNRIVLEPNERYYGEPAKVQQVILLMGTEASQPLVSYEQGRVDYVEVSTSVVARLDYPGSPYQSELRVSPELSLSYIGFNTQMAPLDDPKVRQAMTMALDRAKIARVTYEGRLVQAQGILPPGMPGYDETLVGLPYDPDQARQLLAESKYGGPEGMPRITLYTSGDPTAALAQEVWRRELGLEVELRHVEWADFLTGLDERRYPMFTLSWIADYPDPQNFLEVLFHSASGSNHTAYANPEVDRLLDQAAGEQDPARRLDLYRQAERLIVADAPVIPISHGVSYSLTKPYVQGLQVTPMGVLDLASISVDRQP